MDTCDFVQDKLTEWDLSELIQRFEDNGIDMESFLCLEESGTLNDLIPKIGPRVKFRKRLREYLQALKRRHSDTPEMMTDTEADTDADQEDNPEMWNAMDTCDFVQDKLTEWDLSELIQRFEDNGIDKESFLSLEESGTLNDLIPKIGLRVKFRKRLREYLQALKRRHTDTAEMMTDTEADTDSDQEDNPEMDSFVFPWNFEFTSTSDTDCDEMTEPMSNSNPSTGLLAVILFTLRYHLTTAVGDLMALIHFLSPKLVGAFKCLSDKIPILSIVFYCHRCQNYMGANPVDAQCLHCGTIFDKKSSTKRGHFFLSSSLKDLLRGILKNHGTELLPKTINHGNDIKDVMDGKMYQDLLKQGKLAPDDLTLLWNCDEAPLFNSARESIWPLQFTINELPYIQRKENVTVAGLWFGAEKPKMNTFLKPFIDECCDLEQNPFQWRDSNDVVHSSKVFSLVCSSDAVVRPLLRNCKKFNGKYGCDWCLHPGLMVKTKMSYPYDENTQVARSNEMFRDNATQAENSAPKNGVKGLSLLSILPYFDIVFGFVPDYLHSVLVGVSKQLMSLWLNPENCSKPWYIGGQISQMDSCLRRLQLTLETRSPRSLKCRDSWKASEWRVFLLFYAISVLPGILHPTFLEHYFYLSISIHILLQESISRDDLKLAHKFLVHFVKRMEELYGKENVSFNCHQLIHLTESVENWGPLWATSTFSFERNNGNLRTLFKGINDNPQQIYQRFLIWQHLPRHLSSLVFNRHSDFSELLAQLTPVEDGSGPDKLLGKSHHVDLTGSTKLAVQELLNRPVLVKSVEAYDSFSKGHTVYHTTKCDKTDCVIKLKNGCCAEIQLILLLKENCICTCNCLCQAIPIIVVHRYEIKHCYTVGEVQSNNTSKSIFERVEKTDQLKAFFLEDVRCKCTYVDGWCVALPNTYERY